MGEEIPKPRVNPMIVIVFQQGDACLSEEVIDTLLSKSLPLSTYSLAGNSKKSLCMTPRQHDERLVLLSSKNTSHQKSEVAGCTEEKAEHLGSKKQKDTERRDYIVVQLFLICAVLVLLVASIIVYQLSKDDKVFNTVSPYFTLIVGYFFGFHKNKK